MTSNQIQYWRNVETERSNRTNEQETHRSNVVRERETMRSNLAKEFETNRHNVETERHNRNLLLESRAQFKASNELGWYQAHEQNRANVARESENTRHNMATEAAQSVANQNARYQAELNAKINQTRASTAQYMAETNRMGILEGVRHNTAMEGLSLLTTKEQKRSNMAREDENRRHNIAQESLSNRNLELDRQRLAESVRHNTATENLGMVHAVSELTTTLDKLYRQYPQYATFGRSGF